ncbi:unnamed protein product [Adineta steineri]|uniref:Helix-turn-helix domain-containing protein n=1 Tax=Adineta steineri TaxID=433720 RepID=A0A815EKQ6_9BILA|nr:unnamed protein product [Adineta steineri]CAF4011202.1 unnamed protein product [Adineta steineri]
MVDQINGSVDIVVQLFDNYDNGSDDDDELNNDNNISICSFDMKNNTLALQQKKEIAIVRIPDYRLNARSLYSIHKNDIQLIRQLFKEQNRLLLKTYQSNAMYSCTMDEFEQKTSAFIEQTNAYSLIQEFSKTNRHCVRKYLDNLVDTVNTTLDNLLQCQSITSMQYEEMKVLRSKVRLDYLFFLSDTRKIEVSVQPIMVSCASPFINISRLLNRLLKPIYDQIAFNTTFHKGSDAVQALHTYENNGYLRSTTMFVTLHMNHILTILSHHQSIEILERFLYDNVSSKEIQGISISTMIQLVRLILDNQWFIYRNNKIYRQILGGGSGSPFMSLLVNIILLDWQKEFVLHLQHEKEVFGRCFDEIFFTWNKSKEELDQFIQKMNSRNASIQVQFTIGTEINYLDTYIRFFYDEVDNISELETQVNHESNVEPYVLPFIYNHPSHMYNKLIRAALIRATLCCSSIYEFQQERQYIELSFKINHFPDNFIDEHVTVFFLEFNMEVFDYMMYNEETYQELRKNVLEYDQKCIQNKLKQQQQAQNYNLQYVSLSTKKKLFRHLKQYSQRQRTRSHDSSHSKFYMDVAGRPKYPSNTK